MQSLRNNEFRQQLKRTLCVKVCGRAVVEDYERMKSTARAFPEIVKLINKSTESNLKKSSEFNEIQGQITELELAVKQTKDRNLRAVNEQKLKGFKTLINDQLLKAAGVDSPAPWILDGIKTWIDAFLPGIVNLRIYPSITRPDEHVFGHLKKDCFEDADSNSFHFTYGSLPTENLTMIGIVTSVPEENGESFKPLEEFSKECLADHEAVERAFRGMFRGFDGMEQVIRTCRFPRVLVHPLTVYRSVESNPSFQRVKAGHK